MEDNLVKKASPTQRDVLAKGSKPAFKFEIKKILFPFDFSETAMKALDHAVHLANLTNAEIILIHVLEGVMGASEPTYIEAPLSSHVLYENNVIDKCNVDLAQLSEKIHKKGEIKITTITRAGSAHNKIVKIAGLIEADLIVMGTHGVSGFREFIIGSNASRVVSEALCPVLTIQEHTKDPGFKNILLPFRDKPHSREKVDYAIKMAKLYGSVIHVLGVDTEESETDFNKIVLEAEQIKKIIEKQELECEVKVISGSYLSDLILKYAKSNEIDLIVAMSDMDRVNISEYIMGPVIQQIINHSPIPVLSVRPSFNPNTIDLHGYGW
jgi:nucleotide-binding universal stress UspA family protein